MGLDGFSLSNLGLNRNLSSAQLAQNAEATARQSLDNQIADVDGVGKKEKAGRKDPDAAFNGRVPFVGPNKEDKEEEDDEQQSNESPISSNDNSNDEEDDEDASRYHFRFNANNMVEIWDSETNSVIKTLPPKEAANVMLSFSKAPGIFVNKEV